MDSYIQMICRFQKCKQKVPLPSLLSNENSPSTAPKKIFSHPLGGATVEELFSYIFGICIKFGHKNPSILTLCDLLDVAT